MAKPKKLKIREDDGPGVLLRVSEKALRLPFRIDEEDAEAIAAHSWQPHYVAWSDTICYWANSKGEYLGPFVLGLHGVVVKANQAVLHVNGILSDARRSNLRLVGLGTVQQRRSLPKRDGQSASRFIGVSQVMKKGEPTHKWIAKARLSTGALPVYLGCYETETEAALAYDRAVIQVHGDLAKTNLISPKDYSGD